MATARAAEIKDVGTLVDFDPYDQADIPDEPGVYPIFDSVLCPGAVIGRGSAVGGGSWRAARKCSATS
jgi:hypothetical protein